MVRRTFLRRFKKNGCPPLTPRRRWILTGQNLKIFEKKKEQKLKNSKNAYGPTLLRGVTVVERQFKVEIRNQHKKIGPETGFECFL